MKNTKLVTTLALATTLTGLTIYLLKKCQRERRLAVISDAGYETAYDVHFPMKYRK